MRRRTLTWCLGLQLVLLSPPGAADEAKAPAGFFPTDDAEKIKHIPEPVRAATTYRIVPLEEVRWLPRPRYLQLEASSEGIVAKLMREFREECEKGEDSEDPILKNPMYEIYWKEIGRTIERDKCKTRVPVFFNSSATAFPAIGKNKIVTVAHVFQDDVDSFGPALREVESYSEAALAKELKALVDQIKSPEGARLFGEKIKEVERAAKVEDHKGSFTQNELDQQIIQRVARAGYATNLPRGYRFVIEGGVVSMVPDTRTLLTPQEEAKVLAEAKKNFIKGAEDKWKKQLNISRLVALGFFWKFPLRFWLFDSAGDVIYAPSADGQRSAQLSVAFNADVMRVHKDMPNLKPMPFVDLYNPASGLYGESKLVTTFVENIYGAIVITVNGVTLDPPLPFEDAIQPAVGEPVYIRGYPRFTWEQIPQKGEAANSDGDKEFISTGEVLSPERFYEDSPILKVAKPAELKQLLEGTGKMLTLTNAAAAQGNSGGPMLNEAGKVIGIVNMGTQFDEVENNFAFGPSGWGALGWMESYLELHKLIQDPEVQSMLKALDKKETR